MCGIIAYIGKRESAPILFSGLKNLEYRGYDSAGIAVLNKDIKIIKQKGRVADLEDEAGEIKGKIGIAHTRWATHGLPNKINAHPHHDCKGNIAVVHNGIIENFPALRDMLEKEGHKFVSETDTEVLPHLIEKFYSGNLEKAVIESLKLIEGTFGIAVLHRKHDEIIVARRGSPLILGIGKNEMFAASDAPAILRHTKKVVYLEDDDIAVLCENKYRIKNLDGSRTDRKIHEIMYSIDQIEKGNFKHFMLKEIFEQPESIRNTLRGRIKNNRIKLTLNINAVKTKRIIITACGTSWHSALIGKHLIEKIAKIPVEVDYASEFRYRNPIIHKDDLVIVISQSGETADTLAALNEAKEKGARTAGIINVVGSTIAREVDSGIYLHAGPEIGVASTKAFTCQVASLILLALWLRQEKGMDIPAKFLSELKKLPEKVQKTLESKKQVAKIAAKFCEKENFLYLGRGINFPVALEGALKLKEISYIHAEGYPAAEMKHGPIALIDEKMPVVFAATKDRLSKKIMSNMEEVRARKGKIIAIVNNETEEIKKLADYIIKVPATFDELKPVINVIPMQLLAYHIADMKGLDVDKPRNLAKSVTVE